MKTKANQTEIFLSNEMAWTLEPKLWYREDHVVMIDDKPFYVDSYLPYYMNDGFALILWGTWVNE